MLLGKFRIVSLQSFRFRTIAQGGLGRKFYIDFKQLKDKKPSDKLVRVKNYIAMKI